MPKVVQSSKKCPSGWGKFLGFRTNRAGRHAGGQRAGGNEHPAG
jgi:hypothetical protein